MVKGRFVCAGLCQSKGRPTWTETTIASTTRKRSQRRRAAKKGSRRQEEPQAVDSERGYQALLAKQEARIKELEGQVAEAAKSAEVADALRGEIQQVKARRPMSASPSRQTWRRSQP